MLERQHMKGLKLKELEAVGGPVEIAEPVQN